MTRTTLLSTVTRIALGAALVFVAGCSGADDRPPVVDLGSAGAAGSGGAGGAGGGASTEPVTGPCESGIARECKIRLPSHAGVSNCFVGVQLCENGAWGNCVDPADVSTTP